jgi:signal transduction histidine kinase
MGVELAPTAMEKGHSLSLEVPDKVIFARGHYDLLLSAAMNLLDNAIKYTPRGGDIIVSVCDGDLVGIRVTDNGPGFTPPVRAEGGDERFVRGEHSARSGVSGAGLGLSIVREVVSRHRGRLEVTAGPEGRGTSVTLWVPRSNGVDVTTAQDHHHREPGEQKEQHAPAHVRTFASHEKNEA